MQLIFSFSAFLKPLSSWLCMYSFIHTNTEKNVNSIRFLYQTSKMMIALITIFAAQLICRSSMDHPHHTLFIILALVNANKDECFSRSRLSKSSVQQPSPLDLVHLRPNKKSARVRSASFQAVTFWFCVKTHRLLMSSESILDSCKLYRQH